MEKIRIRDNPNIPICNTRKWCKDNHNNSTRLGAILMLKFWAYYLLCTLPESPERLDTGGPQLLVPALQPAQRQLALVSHAGHLRTHHFFAHAHIALEFNYILQQLALVSHAGHLHTHRHFTEHAHIGRTQLYTAAACSTQSRGTSAHTDILLRMRKVKKYSILCSQPSGSLLSSVTRDICAHTQTFYCACAKLRNIAYYAASPAAACSRQSRETSAHT